VKKWQLFQDPEGFSSYHLRREDGRVIEWAASPLPNQLLRALPIGCASVQGAYCSQGLLFSSVWCGVCVCVCVCVCVRGEWLAFRGCGGNVDCATTMEVVKGLWMGCGRAVKEL